MKIYAFLLIVALPLIAADFQVQNITDARRAHDACRDAIKPPPKLFEQFLVLRFPPHETTACYIQCLLEKLQFFDRTQGFLIENIVKQLTQSSPESEAIVMRAIKRCMTAKPPQVATCFYAATTFGCFMTYHRDFTIMSFNLK